MDKLSITNLEPFYPEKRLIEHVPEDAQIVIVGDYFSNTYHQQWLYLNFPDFAAKNFHYAVAQRKNLQQGAEHMVDGLGYRPYHMQRYAHVVFIDDRNLTTHDLPAEDNKNVLKILANAAAQYKFLKAANRFGMGYSFVEDPSYDADEYQNDTLLNRRCNHIANCAADIAAKGKKLLLHCPQDFLYQAPDNDGLEFSLQQLLQKKGFKTVAFSLLNEPSELLLDNEDATVADYIQIADESAAEFLDDYIRQHISNPDDIDADDEENAFDIEPIFNTLTKAFYLNARLATKKAGTSLPDQFVVFPQASFDAVFEKIQYAGLKTNPVLEDEFWQQAWRDFGLPAHKTYKAARKDAQP